MAPKPIENKQLSDQDLTRLLRTPDDKLSSAFPGRSRDWLRSQRKDLLRAEKQGREQLTDQERELLRQTPECKYVTTFPGRRFSWLRKQKRNLIHGDSLIDKARVKGESIYYNGEGHVTGRWVKTSVSHDQSLEALKQAALALGKEIKIPEVSGPKQTKADLLVVYPLGDPHLGMYAAAREAGEDFNIEIAERNLVAATRHLVDLAPPAQTALIANLGDYIHADNFLSRTMRGGNVLDVAARWWEVFGIGIKAMKALINLALEKHRTVKVVMKMGNHDDQTAIALSYVLAESYRDNPRVEVDTAPLAYHYMRFYRVLIGIAHGHLSKGENLGQIMATDRPKDWGETVHRYFHCGHVHHASRDKEIPGCIVETHRTLAPRDAWAQGAGYRAGRHMQCIVYDKDHGERLRHTVGVGML